MPSRPSPTSSSSCSTPATVISMDNSETCCGSIGCSCSSAGDEVNSNIDTNSDHHQCRRRQRWQRQRWRQISSKQTQCNCSTIDDDDDDGGGGGGGGDVVDDDGGGGDGCVGDVCGVGEVRGGTCVHVRCNSIKSSMLASSNTVSRSATIAMAALATTASLFEITAASGSSSSSLAPSSSSSFSSASGGHHQHYNSHSSLSHHAIPSSSLSSLSSLYSSVSSAVSGPSESYSEESSPARIVNTVRRISLNILNSSSSALEQLRSAVHYHHPHHQAKSLHKLVDEPLLNQTLLDADQESSDSTDLTSSLNNSTTSALLSEPAKSSSFFASTISNIGDVFPSLLPKSSSFELNLQPPSTFSDDYEDDYVMSSFSDHHMDMSKEFSLDNGASTLPSTLVSHLSSSESSDEESSEQMLMRLMRQVMQHASETASKSLAGAHHADHDDVYETGRSPNSALFASNKANDNLLSDSYSSSASLSPSSHSLIPSFSSSAASAVLNPSSVSSSVTAMLSAATNQSQYQPQFKYHHQDNSIVGGYAEALTSPGQAMVNMFQYGPNLTDTGHTVDASPSLTTISDSTTSYVGGEFVTSLATLVNSFDVATMASSETNVMEPLDWFDIVMIVLKVLVLGTIILSAIFGNMLVIISVFRHHRLRTTTNNFIVSLAFADILVALFAMTFNASVVISGRWLFNMVVCDFWNSCDVLFSTASIMHLSCISYDRYYAIIKPLDYPMKITTKRVAIMIACVWISSALISYIPIFTGIYTTQDAIEQRKLPNPECEWIVNIPYALISSTVSFWLPCGFMLTAYYKIYREAIKQEKFIYKTQQMANASNHHHQQQQQNRVNTNPNTHLNAPRHSSASENNVIQIQSQHRNSHGDDPESGSSTPTKRTISKMKREHKAAKTLGIIMGAFILCWLPFFIWYVTSTICGSNCNTPKLIVDLLFWVGYLNSAMNPIIYAYFNREFREAFKETLRNIFCCCLHLRCLESQRSDAISFSCTYRSTMDVGLVENKYVKD